MLSMCECVCVFLTVESPLRSEKFFVTVPLYIRNEISPMSYLSLQSQHININEVKRNKEMLLDTVHKVFIRIYIGEGGKRSDGVKEM